MDYPLLDRPYVLPEALLDRLTGISSVLSGVKELPPAEDGLFHEKAVEIAQVCRCKKVAGGTLLLELMRSPEASILLIEGILALLGLSAWTFNLEEAKNSGIDFRLAPGLSYNVSVFKRREAFLYFSMYPVFDGTLFPHITIEFRDKGKAYFAYFIRF
ncbi:hypothetical protein [Thermosulfurimonas dismutans]|uniref:Uncharacterized protein n=1 Tax=Thermosulfurimonas dismutans TaxID=999894 RepID=A0A179D709_9BACT|nr:hypothetical protein [Thermosulfurimonas dismutans]OAQ21836.1 hypothetical protein TDIS_0354 [Thermosulfurimonas dismutans]